MRRTNQPIDIFLMPGEYFVGGSAYRLRTLLGSCVSITLWHAERRIGAISHFLLSSRLSVADAPPNPRYGADAFGLMLRDLAALNIDPSECEAKVFGGANTFVAGHLGQASTIGRKNGELARQLLRTHGIPIASESLYGNGHRRIVFNIGTGDVWSHHVTPDAGASLILPRPARHAPAA